MPQSSMKPVSPLQLLTWQHCLAVGVAFVSYKILQYFTRRSPLDHVRGPPGAKFVEGHLGFIFDVKTGLDFSDHVTEEYGTAAKVKGVLGEDHIFISDPRGLEHMLLKAMSDYEEPPLATLRFQIILGPGVLGTIGKQHKKHRKLLNPAFSSSHISKLFPLFHDLGCKLKEKLEQNMQSGSNDVDILHWMSVATLEFVGQGALGYRFGTLEDTRNDYQEASRLLLPTLARLGLIEAIGAPISRIGPTWFRRLLVDLCPIPVVQELKKIIDVMHHTAVGVYQDRKHLLEHEGAGTQESSAGLKDALTLIMKANSKLGVSDRLSEDELTSQLSTLMFAGTEALAGAMSRVFDVLASHQDAQDKLRKELASAEAESPLDYEKLSSLPFLDAVCKETLRLHPPVPRIPRTCLKDDTIPLLQPVRSTTNRTVTEIHVPKGTTVWVDILGANRNKSVWGEDACEWKPERWLTSDLSGKPRLPGAYSHMMTFMGGDRPCLGFRMAILEIKVVLAVLLPNLRFEPSSQTVAWRLGTTLAPFVECSGEAADRGPELPMKLSVFTDS